MVEVQKHPKIEMLDNAIATLWQEVFTSEMARELESSFLIKDKRVYALYMMQVYHYASQTPRNLALAGANIFNRDVRLMHHCFEHAMEETGHELMALNDLRALGVPITNAETDMPPPLPATESIVAYVKHIATGSSPHKILGYNYWIEKPYQYILPFMQMMQDNMKLEDKQLTFYYNHIQIDKKHGNDIEDILIKICETEKQWEEIEMVMVTTMRLTINMFFEIIKEYKKVIAQESKSFSILNKLHA